MAIWVMQMTGEKIALVLVFMALVAVLVFKLAPHKVFDAPSNENVDDVEIPGAASITSQNRYRTYDSPWGIVPPVVASYLPSVARNGV